MKTKYKQSLKLRYNKKDDVLMIQLSEDKIDYAEQSNDLIVHFSLKRKAVLLEILDASQFLKKATKNLPKKIKEEILDQPVSTLHQIKP